MLNTSIAALLPFLRGGRLEVSQHGWIGGNRCCGSFWSGISQCRCIFNFVSSLSFVILLYRLKVNVLAVYSVLFLASSFVILLYRLKVGHPGCERRFVSGDLITWRDEDSSRSWITWRDEDLSRSSHESLPCYCYLVV